MSLANIQGKLSRAEMKKIMAGSGGNEGKCGDNCRSNTDCKDTRCPTCRSKNGGPYICDEP
jgi:hypothetical protein